MSGQINWVELPAADTARARAFYGSLFGWGTSEFGGDYHVIANGPAGAIAPRGDGFTHPRVYFGTGHIGASAKHVRELGGRSEDVRTHPRRRPDRALPRRPGHPVQPLPTRRTGLTDPGVGGPARALPHRTAKRRHGRPRVERDRFGRLTGGV